MDIQREFKNISLNLWYAARSVWSPLGGKKKKKQKQKRQHQTAVSHNKPNSVWLIFLYIYSYLISPLIGQSATVGDEYLKWLVELCFVPSEVLLSIAYLATPST